MSVSDSDGGVQCLLQSAEDSGLGASKGTATAKTDSEETSEFYTDMNKQTAKYSSFYRASERLFSTHFK